MFFWLIAKITEVNLYAFIYRLFHEDSSSVVRTNTLHSDDPSL